MRRSASWKPGGLRMLACGGVAAIGGFAVVGCLLGLLFEISGLGRPSDTGMRPGHMAGLITGVIAGVAVPLLVFSRLLDGSIRLVHVVVAASTVFVLISVLGIVDL